MRGRKASPGKRLHQMSLERLSRLLQHGNGQLLGGSQAQMVAVVADMAMGAPVAFGNAPLMMGRECSPFPTKRNEPCSVSQANHSGVSGSKGSKPCLGQSTT